MIDAEDNQSAGKQVKTICGQMTIFSPLNYPKLALSFTLGLFFEPVEPVMWSLGLTRFISHVRCLDNRCHKR